MRRFSEHRVWGVRETPERGREATWGGQGRPQRWQMKGSKVQEMLRLCGLLSCSFPGKGRCGWWLLCPTRRAEAAPSWGPKSLLPLLPTLPSPSLRFQCNFQLTSMSIEQVGQPDCWPITGNHSPQLRAQGEGGREGGNVREQTPSLQAGKGLWLCVGPDAAPGRAWGGRAGVDGEASGGGPAGVLPHPQTWPKPQRERTGLRADEEGPGGEAFAWSRRG